MITYPSAAYDDLMTTIDLDDPEEPGCLFDRPAAVERRRARACRPVDDDDDSDGVCPECELRHPPSVDCDGEDL